MRRSPGRGRSPFTAVLVGLLAAALAYVAAVQVRSEAAVQRALATKDPTTLAFLIDDLHSANDALANETSVLQARATALRQAGNGGSTAAVLNSEIAELKVIEGYAPARGPGVVISIDAQLQALDLQDALNNLRISGAEAIAVNGRRVVTGTPISDEGRKVVIGGVLESRPWTIDAIGDPAQLASAADAMTHDLQADPRVTVASWRAEPLLTIPGTVPQRPFVYGTPG